MIPIPSKRGFGHPFPIDALAHLVDPEPGHEFSKPFRDAEGYVVAYNGALAVRIRSYLPLDEIDFADQPFEDLGLCLGRWPDAGEPKGKDAKLWKAFDDDSLPLWKYGAKPAWIMRGGKVMPNQGSTVSVGAGFSAPLTLVQLCARLPRCKVKVDTSLTAPLQMVWNGGEALLRHIDDLAPVSFRILRPKTDHFTGTHIFD